MFQYFFLYFFFLLEKIYIFPLVLKSINYLKCFWLVKVVEGVRHNRRIDIDWIDRWLLDPFYWSGGVFLFGCEIFVHKWGTGECYPLNVGFHLGGENVSI